MKLGDFEQLRPRTAQMILASRISWKNDWATSTVFLRYLILGLWAIAPLTLVLPHAEGASLQNARDQNPRVQADEAKNSSDCPQAIAHYEQALRTQPENESAQLRLAKTYLVCRQFRAAITTYQLVLRRDPQNRDALTGTGEAYNLLGEYAKAERPLLEALRVAPGNADAAWALSRTYLYESRLGDAERLLNAAVETHPLDYRLWESLGEVQLHQGHRVNARNSLQRALELNPNAKRAQILLRTHEIPKPAMKRPGLNIEFHDQAYLLSDGVGNQILNFPQTLRMSYGSRWSNEITGEYRRVAFSPRNAAGASLTAGIASITDGAAFRVNRTVTLTGGGGTSHYLAQGITRPVYHAGFKFTPLTGLQLSFTYRQRIVAPTELAARLALTQRGWSSHLGYILAKSTSLDLTYYQDQLSDTNRLRGGHAEIRHVVLDKPVRVSLGYQFENLSFNRLDLFHGYFSPKRFIANTALLNFKGKKGGFHYDYDINIGEETYTRPVVTGVLPFSFVTMRRSGPRFVALMRNSYEFNPEWSLQFSFLLYRSALSSGTGAYQAQAFLFGLTRRF